MKHTSEVAETVEVGRPRQAPVGPQVLDAEQAQELIEQAREQGIELLGEGGLLKQMTRAVLERALAEELTDHLGYEIGDPAGNGSGNSRNGYTPGIDAIPVRLARSGNAAMCVRSVREAHKNF